MPDKAIDLVDEACANVRVQLDSVPEDIDVLRRQKYRLEVEEKAISKEKDKARPPTTQCLTLQPRLHACLNRPKPAPAHSSRCGSVCRATEAGEHPTCPLLLPCALCRSDLAQMTKNAS